MCGIVGYIGNRQAVPILMDGLARLSYRGYDSAGVAVADESGKIQLRKSKGKINQLQRKVEESPLLGCIGIGHTRWATHGEPSDQNAHPHTDVMGGIAVVHNGIIENHQALRKHLQRKGVRFVSQTDTEVVAHLLHDHYHGDMLQAIRQSMAMLEGSYAIGVLCDREPGRLFCARSDSPLVIGFQNGEGYIASDIPALLTHTRNMVFLEDKEIGVLDQSGLQVYDAYGQRKEQSFFHVDWDLASAEKSGYAHYMLKEIHEQPNALRHAMAQRSRMGDYAWLPITPKQAREIKKITIAACGTAYHAGVYAKYVLEKLARIPVEVEVASEYRYRSSVQVPNEWLIVISQSGETADTLAALRMGKQRGMPVLAVCNAVGSSIAREAGEANTLYTYAGPEIAVASTKAYLTQVETLVTLAAALADLRESATKAAIEQFFDQLYLLPQKAEQALACETELHRLADRLVQKKHVFFIGRGLDYAVSMEAALKLKEVSYVFSEAYPAGELKHGPLALIQEGSLVVASITQSDVLEKTLSNLREVASRGAYLIAICPESFVQRVQAEVSEVIPILDTDPLLAPLTAAIPMQLFAYCMAVERGCDVDQPRNLAKSVTVE